MGDGVRENNAISIGDAIGDAIGEAIGVSEGGDSIRVSDREAIGVIGGRLGILIFSAYPSPHSSPHSPVP
nr:MAG: hypothetical protein [Bacteriophage sp.]